MQDSAGKIAINGAPSQNDRWLRALDPGYAKVDGRTFTQLLDFATRFGRLIYFYDTLDRIDGDWQDFFAVDPTMLLASMEVSDGAALEARYLALQDRTRSAWRFERKFACLKDLFGLILETARQADNLVRGFERCQDDETVRLARNEVRHVIETTLAAQLQRLRAYDEGAGAEAALGRRIGLDYDGFLPLWGLGHVQPDPSIYMGETPQRKIDNALAPLGRVFRTFAETAQGFRAFAEDHLPETLARANHKPDVALFMAFASLFDTAQDTINRMSRRYAQFYYRDVLRGRQADPIPDSAYLTFTLVEDEAISGTTVPKGTLFTAGQDDDGNDILFASDRPVTVSPAAIAAIRTLRVVDGDLLPPQTGNDGVADADGDNPVTPLTVTRKLFASDILGVGDGEDEAEQEGGASDGATGAAVLPTWTTFGAATAGTTATEDTRTAVLGFALASPSLSLSGGERTVAVEIGYGPSYLKNTLTPMLDALAQATGNPTDAIFQTVLQEAFSLYLSTAAGWFPVDRYTPAVSLDPGDPSFSLTVVLPGTVPPIAAIDPEGGEGEEGGETVSQDSRVNATNPAPSAPTMKAYLRQVPVTVTGPDGSVQVEPISLLAALPARSFQISVDVADLAGLQLSNTDGEIDSSAPYAVFGGVPTVGSYLQITHEELFAKHLDTLNIAIKWFGLPANQTGFAGYYRYYVIGPNDKEHSRLVDNTVFRRGIDVVNPGLWTVHDGKIKTDDGQKVEPDNYLFRTRTDDKTCKPPPPDPDGPLCGSTDFDDLVIKKADKTPPYYDPAASAIRISLTAPPFAFGNDIYPKNVLKSVIDDLPDAGRCTQTCQEDCKSWTGQAMAFAEEIIAVLTVCDSKPGDQYPACVWPGLEKIIINLTKTGKEVLADCPPDENSGVVREWSGKLSAALSDPTATLHQDLNQSLGETQTAVEALRAAKPGTGLVACQQAGAMYLAVAREIRDCFQLCLAGDKSKFKQCLTTRLNRPIEQLNTAFNDCLQTCMEDCMSIEKELKYPNEPYLPQAETVTVGYSAAATLPDPAQANPQGRFFHLTPFGGYAELTPEAGRELSLLPRFPEPGNLYIGLSGATRPGSLTLLFQMAAAEADGGAADLPPVTWSYLANNEWQPFLQRQVLSDTTNGLRNTGIVTLQLPGFHTAGNTVLPADRQWLGVTVPDMPAAFPGSIAVIPQAVLASWVPDGGAGERLSSPLPAHTITAPFEDLADISAVDQPMPSFGGRPAETARAFEIRLGERLRHKDRAVLAWDYERLVLERFPTIWKVVALPAHGLKRRNRPGGVLVVVVPGPDAQVTDPTAPGAPSDLLAAIERYLRAKASPFAGIRVVNPVYVRVQVMAMVQFADRDATGDGIERLNEDLIGYLSPWYYDAARAARGGHYAGLDDITAFILARPYVDALVSIDIRHDPDPAGLSSDWYFLTSALEHQIFDARVEAIS